MFRVFAKTPLFALCCTPTELSGPGPAPPWGAQGGLSICLVRPKYNQDGGHNDQGVVSPAPPPPPSFVCADCLPFVTDLWSSQQRQETYNWKRQVCSRRALLCGSELGFPHQESDTWDASDACHWEWRTLMDRLCFQREQN